MIRYGYDTLRYRCLYAGGHMKGKRKTSMNFGTMAQIEVPQGRNGKHKEVITKILSDLDRLTDGKALKIPLAQLMESKEKVRSALNRATRKSGREVATASDTDYLYIWNQNQ